MEQNTATTSNWTEYAVEMHDIDGATSTLANVWLKDNERTDAEYVKAAEAVCAKQHGFVFAGNTVEYACADKTGRTKRVDIITQYLTDYNEEYNDNSFFKISDE
jgi:hypothetical protein